MHIAQDCLIDAPVMTVMKQTLLQFVNISVNLITDYSNLNPKTSTHWMYTFAIGVAVCFAATLSILKQVLPTNLHQNTNSGPGLKNI